MRCKRKTHASAVAGRVGVGGANQDLELRRDGFSAILGLADHAQRTRARVIQTYCQRREHKRLRNELREPKFLANDCETNSSKPCSVKWRTANASFSRLPVAKPTHLTVTDRQGLARRGGELTLVGAVEVRNVLLGFQHARDLLPLLDGRVNTRRVVRALLRCKSSANKRERDCKRGKRTACMRMMDLSGAFLMSSSMPLKSRPRVFSSQ